MRALVRMVVASAALLFVQPALAADANGAKQFIDSIAGRVLSVLKTDVSQSQKIDRLESIFAGKVDIPYVARFVLGQHWRTATPDQQSRYVSAYGPFVIRNYSKRLSKYSGEQYTLKSARNDGDTYVVTMAIQSPSAEGDVFVDYRLRAGGSAGYLLTDIVVEGISLLATQRSEFGSIVSNKGIEHLITQLQESAKKV